MPCQADHVSGVVSGSSLVPISVQLPVVGHSLSPYSTLSLLILLACTLSLPVRHFTMLLSLRASSSRIPFSLPLPLRQLSTTARQLSKAPLAATSQSTAPSPPAPSPLLFTY